MWKRIAEIANTSTSMLRAGSVPPNTPPEYQQDLSKLNFLASKKFFVVFLSVIILSVFYGVSILVLFLTAPHPNLTLPFVSIFTETIKILAIIIGSYLGVQTVLDYRMQSSSAIFLEKKGEKKEEIILEFAEKYKEDPSYAPLAWVNQYE
jgi:hypothetical protein